jgi:hypothetical protein
LILSLAGALGENVSSASPLTRAQAVALLLSSSSDLLIDTNQPINVWCPYVDYGSGSGYEGLLPAFSTVAAFEPATGPTVLLNSDSYFFWVDTLPQADFEHKVYFVILDANNPSPVLGNGLEIYEENWWPEVTPSSGPLAGVTADYFHTSAQTESASPPGVTNPQGLVVGSTLQPGEISFTGAGAGDPITVTGSANAACVPATNACAIVLFGDVDKITFRNSARLMEQDLINHYGVRTNRIIRAGGNNNATLADLSNSITMLCNAQPPCDKIFIRMASHGGRGRPDLGLEPGFYMRRNNNTDPTNVVRVSATELCNLFKRLADKGVPICALINCCYGGGLLTPNNWNFPAGSSVITATASNTVGLSWCYIDQNGNRFTNQIFTYAFSQCLNANPTNTMNGRRLDRNGDGCVDDEEAFAWVTNVAPCFRICNAGVPGPNNPWASVMNYPARGTNLDIDLKTNFITNKRYFVTNPFVIVPQQRGVGTDPRMINLNVCNGTGTNKTDFHMIFQGNVTNGTASAWRSTVDDRFFVTNYWARGRSNTMITYDSNRNETMVCWTNGASPVRTNQYIHFGYFPPKGSTLRPRRQWWTPTTNPPPALPAIRDRVPTPRPKVLWDPNTALVGIQVLNDSTADGGWGSTLLVTNTVYYSRDLIPLQNLSLGNAAVTNLPLILVNNGSVAPDNTMDFTATLPVSAGDPNPTAVLVTTASWSDNPMVTVTVQALPCNILRGLTAAAGPDQVHLYGPNPNSFPVGATQTLTAMVENQFLGLEGMPVNFTVLMGSVQFAGGGTTASVLTDPSGAANVDFAGTGAGAALIQATSGGLSAYQFVQVTSAFVSPDITIKSAAASARTMTLTIAGAPGQVYDIQCSTDLINWHVVATQTVPDSGTFDFTDTNAPPNCAFYRAVPH